MDLNRRNMKKIAGLIVFAVVLFWMLEHYTATGDLINGLLRLLSPFIMGLCLAFIINVPLRSVENRLFAPLNRRCGRIWKKLRRPCSLIVTAILLVGVILMVLLLVIPELVQTFIVLGRQFPDFWGKVTTYITELAEKYDLTFETITSQSLDWKTVINTLTGFFKNGATSIVSGTVSAAASVVTGVVNFVLGLVISFYILFQKEKLSSQIKRILYAFIPEAKVDEALRIGRLSHRIFSNFITGQFTEAVIIGVLCFIGMAIMRLPYAAMISVLVGFTALVPIFGALIGTAVGAFLILMVSPLKAVWFVLFIIVLHQVEGDFIYPRVVGNSVGLPSLWTLAAVTLGGSISGITGMLISVPLCSVLYCLLRETVDRRLTKRRVPEEKWLVVADEKDPRWGRRKRKSLFQKKRGIQGGEKGQGEDEGGTQQPPDTV